jgi:hypothetical protein
VANDVTRAQRSVQTAETLLMLAEQVSGDFPGMFEPRSSALPCPEWRDMLTLRMAKLGHGMCTNMRQVLTRLVDFARERGWPAEVLADMDRDVIEYFVGSANFLHSQRVSARQAAQRARGEREGRDSQQTASMPLRLGLCRLQAYLGLRAMFDIAKCPRVKLAAARTSAPSANAPMIRSASLWQACHLYQVAREGVSMFQDAGSNAAATLAARAFVIAQAMSMRLEDLASATVDEGAFNSQRTAFRIAFCSKPRAVRDRTRQTSFCPTTLLLGEEEWLAKWVDEVTGHGFVVPSITVCTRSTRSRARSDPVVSLTVMPHRAATVEQLRALLPLLMGASTSVSAGLTPETLSAAAFTPHGFLRHFLAEAERAAGTALETRRELGRWAPDSILGDVEAALLASSLPALMKEVRRANQRRQAAMANRYSTGSAACSAELLAREAALGRLRSFLATGESWCDVAPEPSGAPDWAFYADFHGL